MTIFTFRAECTYDIEQLKKIASREDVFVVNKIDEDLPDREVMMRTDKTLTEVRSLIRRVEDSHVMLQTVQPYQTYTGERDFSLS